MTLSTRAANDPVSQAVLRSSGANGLVPVPLVSTSYDVHISGGLADVVARRTFRNAETESIEATLTFPLPVHAVLYSLEARIGARVVKAVAQARCRARETYEDAVDRGKTAVLHEELVRGVHMLSVAHVAPGTEIEVTARFAIALSWIGERALLRLPMTVGDVYGASRLPDSDELEHGGAPQAASLKVTCDPGSSVLVGGRPAEGVVALSLDAPIDLEVTNLALRDLTGRGADGADVSLTIRPAPVASRNLDAAILVDHSGSMGEPCSGNSRLTKHEAVLLGLTEAADDITESDRLNLWEFDTSVRDLGTAHASTWRSILRSLSGPAGGTEIGGAIDALLAQRPVRDVLIVTDGKSHALDVQRLAALGVRFTVVLIGEDSLEANVGHLAALSGGEIFVPDGADVTAAVRSALGSLRAPHADRAPQSGSEVTVARAGMIISARRGNAREETAEVSPHARAVAAYTACLRLPHLAPEEAVRLAEAEGLVTHLTSLVLVDEEAAAQDGLPVMRKIALPSPATFGTANRPVGHHETYIESSVRALGYVERSAAFGARASLAAAAYDHDAVARSYSKLRAMRLAIADDGGRSARLDATARLEGDPSQIRSLSHLLRRIDWRTEGQRLAEGNMIGLATDVADAIDEAARYGLVRRTAKRLGLEPRLLVIALLARAEAGRDRHAERVARAILAKAKTKDIAVVAERLGLAVTRAGA